MLCVIVLYWTTVHPMQVYTEHAFHKMLMASCVRCTDVQCKTLTMLLIKIAPCKISLHIKRIYQYQVYNYIDKLY